MLVAPVKVGKRAYTGAGSVITKDVPDDALAIERSEQRVIKGYAKRKRAGHQAKRAARAADQPRKGNP
jgi:bifunctional UDP-N-acetylglucosamine pyrophosphorylase/glucosamine-1-phosphate N-acetyltransferase